MAALVCSSHRVFWYMCTDDLVAQGKGSGPESSVYEPFPWFHVFVPASLLITFKRVVPHFLTWFRALIWLSNSSPPPPWWGRKWIEYWYGRMLGVKLFKSHFYRWRGKLIQGLPVRPAVLPRGSLHFSPFLLAEAEGSETGSGSVYTKLSRREQPPGPPEHREWTVPAIL